MRLGCIGAVPKCPLAGTLRMRRTVAPSDHPDLARRGARGLHLLALDDRSIFATYNKCLRLSRSPFRQRDLSIRETDGHPGRIPFFCVRSMENSLIGHDLP